jgi:hypothetical protein
MAVMGQRPKSDLLENGKVAYGGETWNQGLIWDFGMYRDEGNFVPGRQRPPYF